MAYQKQKEVTNEEILDSVLLDYKKVADAPTGAAGENDNNVYKAISLKGVFLVRNPCSWTEYRRNGMLFKRKPEPKFVMSFNDAKAEFGKRARPLKAVRELENELKL